MNHYHTVCQGFLANTRLVSRMPLPRQRDTIVSLFDVMHRKWPDMSRMRFTDRFQSLEEDRQAETQKWLRLEYRSLTCGFVNPPSLDAARNYHKYVHDRVPTHLGLSGLEIRYLEVLFAFDLMFAGNHNEVIARSVLSSTPLGGLLEIPGAKALSAEPFVIVSLSDDGLLQAKVDIVGRTQPRQVAREDYPEDYISVYLALRQFWSGGDLRTVSQTYMDLLDRAEALSASYVVPQVVAPIAAEIASRS